MPVSVNNRPDQRVVNRIPDLDNDERSCQKDTVYSHVLRPVNRQITLQCKTHVAAKVTSRVCELVFQAERNPLPGFSCGRL